MFESGQDVVVIFDGVECEGEVIQHSNGWVLASIAIDPLADFGSVTSRLSPHSEVMVRESAVRLTA